MSALASWEHRLCEVRTVEKIPSGLDAAAENAIGFFRRRGVLASLREEAQRAEALDVTIGGLGTDALRERIAEVRGRFRRGSRGTGDDMSEALALVREAALRTVGMRPFFVQLLGALALRRGCLAEMATGEGKSLTAALAATLAGWTGRPCHIVTVNDYLAARDAERFAPLYEFCGLRAGAVTGSMAPPERVAGHAAHVTYTTSKELAADFLRDRLQLGAAASATRWSIRLLRDPAHAAQRGVVMRGLHTAIVDEADSVLIDEAVTPLIIAGNETRSGTDEAFQLAWNLAAALAPGVDYRRDEHHREVELLPAGWQQLDALRGSLPALWQSRGRRQELITQALTAREFFEAGRQYVVEEGKVVIVDEFTGRLMPMRKWRHGLHQAIEAKEGIEISSLDETLARMSFQRFFRLFHHLSGMTGTAQEAAPEFWRIYALPVVRIPPNRLCQRRELPDRVFPGADEKWAAVAAEVALRHATGQPVLVGTRSIAASEQLAARLQERGLTPTVLNATRHREEAEIVEAAGLRGRITIATNMAGRGTDIVLGAGVTELGGLHVVATERHESGRIDRQLVGRAGRQGDPGSAQTFVSAEDELVRRYTSTAVRGALAQAARREMRGMERLAKLVFAMAQRTAQRQAFRQREQVLKQDDWLESALSFARQA